MQSFGKILKKLRQDSNLTIEELAQKLNKIYGTKLSKSSISRWENSGADPKLEFVRILTDFFKVESSVFFGSYNTNSIDTLSEINATSSQLQPPRQQKVLECAEEQLEEQKKEEEEAKVKKSENKSKVAPFKKSVGDVLEEDSEYEDVNVMGLLTAGKGTLNYDKTNPIACTRVRSCEVPDKYDLAFQITGDSMEPSFKDGEVAYVVTDAPFVDKRIYAVEVEHEAYIKKVYKHSDSFTLVSLNNDVDNDGKLLYPDIEVTEDDEFYIIGRVI
ncbi:TPA: helix-turn-helix transcriptional regulator [Staphylococcus aureus]|uniref:helix-turn-helix domain-containing protein n=1 Tax=Staphylococcus aureus TaxID=1280 RepID=UPI000E0045F7|nr:XRE family transcriptional regulator [Staphylococcus aureus]SUK03263.1 CI-like repressor, phage associated [Staphylococcus aureus]SUK11222.1 CI-like repressor, phage associated [Staphylococcus aureus]HDD0307649.1 helix-turn-helix transcriptional regulator [Staphylococcus aureus]HDD0314887.1 helix-turn-helix transcriptional regulator [Staphylococcus aureus]HDD0317614.1 helix-turn-helix transcriptional regulator [Staphylococcus aureus]